ncbi:hypothetical protein BDU57DRAFT_367343 [Ampelomyces quisqualis]|uniref:Uncharacterized protein n=1 Tax=Ampelomyces quisqualis TaxID=50730 RepID=A0A6A5QCG4_AMPQU|nr:hypothetical protein BDU57DRAFT_367343 [Ampelomyces quisqualis]
MSCDLAMSTARTGGRMGPTNAASQQPSHFAATLIRAAERRSGMCEHGVKNRNQLRCSKSSPQRLGNRQTSQCSTHVQKARGLHLILLRHLLLPSSNVSHVPVTLSPNHSRTNQDTQHGLRAPPQPIHPGKGIHTRPRRMSWPGSRLRLATGRRQSLYTHESEFSAWKCSSEEVVREHV